MFDDYDYEDTDYDYDSYYHSCYSRHDIDEMDVEGYYDYIMDQD